MRSRLFYQKELWTNFLSQNFQREWNRMSNLVSRFSKQLKVSSSNSQETVELEALKLKEENLQTLNKCCFLMIRLNLTREEILNSLVEKLQLNSKRELISETSMLHNAIKEKENSKRELTPLFKPF